MDLYGPPKRRKTLNENKIGQTKFNFEKRSKKPAFAPHGNLFNTAFVWMITLLNFIRWIKRWKISSDHHNTLPRNTTTSWWSVSPHNLKYQVCWLRRPGERRERFFFCQRKTFQSIFVWSKVLFIVEDHPGAFVPGILKHYKKQRNLSDSWKKCKNAWFVLACLQDTLHNSIHEWREFCAEYFAKPRELIQSDPFVSTQTGCCQFDTRVVFKTKE